MCTLILMFRAWPGWPLLVAANRDELLDRPAEPPERRGGPIPWLGPRDLQAGGTWIGVNAAGVFAGVTNRFGRVPDPRRRTRGCLVPMALESARAADAVAALSGADGSAWNGFHLVVADADEAFLLVGDAETIRCEALAPGIHVATERSFGAAPSARVRRLERWAGALAGGPAPDDAVLEAALAEHAEPGVEGTCVHVPERGYGTRSAAIVRVRPGDVRWRHADGPPCTSPFATLESDWSTP